MKDLHDDEIFGIEYRETDNRLLLTTKRNGVLIFRNVIFFEQEDFSMQNVVFDMLNFNSKNIPPHIAERFQSLDFFARHDAVYDIYYIEPSAGLEMLIVCHHAT